MKQLTLVLEEFNASGGLRVLSAIADVAALAGIDVIVVCPDYAAEPFFRLNPKVNIKAIATGLYLRRISYLFTLCRMRWICDGIFITGSYRLIGIIAAVGRMARRESPLLIIQGVDRVSLIDLTSTSWVAKLANRSLLELSQRISCHRVYVSRFLKDAYGQPGTLIPNFVSSQFLHCPALEIADISSGIRIGCVCTSAPNKGFNLFLEAFAKMKSDLFLGMNIQFACATQDRVLTEQYSTSGIIFFRPTSDAGMFEFYRSCQIFVSLSVSEGFGLPVLAAMASGCAVVSTNSGGVTDFVLDGQTGLLLSERSTAALEEALRLLILDTQKRETLATAGKTHAKNYTYDRFAKSYLRLFHELDALP